MHTHILSARTLLAAVFDGGGIQAGLSAANGIQGLSHKPLRELVITIVIQVLNFLSLAAVIVIISAGIYLILGFGEESTRERAQRMIIYTVIGLLIVFLARLIVGTARHVVRHAKAAKSG